MIHVVLFDPKLKESDLNFKLIDDLMRLICYTDILKF